MSDFTHTGLGRVGGEVGSSMNNASYAIAPAPGVGKHIVITDILAFSKGDLWEGDDNARASTGSWPTNFITFYGAGHSSLVTPITVSENTAVWTGDNTQTTIVYHVVSGLTKLGNN